MSSMTLAHVYKVRPRNGHRSADLTSKMLLKGQGFNSPRLQTIDSQQFTAIAWAL